MITNVKVKKIIAATTVILIVAYLIFFVFMFANASEKRICSSCHVAILDSATLRFISEKEVLSFLKGDEISPYGKRLERIDEALIEKKLESKPRIKKAECYVTPNGNVCIDVLQREPVLRVMSSDANYYVDLDGKIMQVSENFAAYVPIVTGAVTEKFAKGKLYEFVLFLRQDKFWNAFVEQIDVNEKEELTIVPRVGNQLVRLGTLNDYEKKLNKLLAVYQYGFNQLGWNMYKEINLMYEGQVVCTKK